MRIFLLYVFLVLSGGSAYSQATIKEIKQVDTATGEEYIFPDIIVPGQKSISRKINDRLRGDMLDADPGTPVNKIFNNVWTTQEFPARLHDIATEIATNKNNVLSIAITGEGCGAYCENFTRYYTFNTRTGNMLELDSFINRQGIGLLWEQFSNSIMSQIKGQLKTANDSLRSASIRRDQEEMERYSEMMQLYSTCQETKRNLIGPLDFMIVNGNQLIVYEGRCSAHVNRALDDLGEFHFTILLKDWSKYLTDYGKQAAGL